MHSVDYTESLQVNLKLHPKNLSKPLAIKILFGIFLSMAIGLLAVNLVSSPEAELSQLEANFRTANQAKTIGPMLCLYHLEGSDERSITRLKGALQYELGLPIKSITFEPLSGAPEETIEFNHNGTDYCSTLKALYKMRVVYKGEDHFVSLFTIGKTTSGEWKFIAAKPVISSSH